MAKNQHVLVVDDDKKLLEMLKKTLVQNQFIVTAVPSLQTMKKELALKAKVDLLLLDINLPDGDAVKFLSDSKNAGEELPPTILITAEPDQMSEALSLDYGADDYIAKPVDAITLVARIKALLRRSSNNQNVGGNYFAFAGWKLDLKSQELISPGQARVFLSYGQYQLLCYFLENDNQVISRSKLCDLMAKESSEQVTDRSLDIRISRLRRLFPKSADLIKTVRGVGYIFSAEVRKV